MFHVYKREKLSLTFLLGAAILLFLFACILDPYLNPWDERFHALVAKNLMKHPLLPTLYDETPLNMIYGDDWARNHVWLHKQPLFLWEIALSYKIFGVNEFALRFPSAFLSVISVYAIYRSGKILSNSAVGYYAAFLFTSSYYMVQLISGYKELEHNDVSFIGYITLSIWSWLEYSATGKKKWLILIGLFSGCAILCKWMVGLLVYLGWGIYSVLENKLNVRKYWDILFSLCITILVFMPWQLLITKWYPAEAREFYSYSNKHLFEAVEGHEGPWYYHFALMGDIFGKIAPLLILPAIVFFYLKTKNKKIFFGFLSMILFVYLLFSYAATKMPSFTVVLVAPIFLSVAFLIDYLVTRSEKAMVNTHLHRALIVLALACFAYVRLDILSLNDTHSLVGEQTTCRKVWMSNKKIFQNLKLPENAVLFNVSGRNYVDAMFYTGITSYRAIPTEEQYQDIKKKNRIIALFRPLNDSIPSYMQNDPSVIILNDTIRLCE